MSHKCAQEECGFHLPDAYPLPCCPWHTLPEEEDPKTKIVVVAALAIAVVAGYGIGKGVAAWKQTKRRRVIREGQAQWRERKGRLSDFGGSDESDVSDEDGAAI